MRSRCGAVNGTPPILRSVLSVRVVPVAVRLRCQWNLYRNHSYVILTHISRCLYSGEYKRRIPLQNPLRDSTPQDTICHLVGPTLAPLIDTQEFSGPVHIARNLMGSRLLILGTYRNVEVDQAHPLSGVLAGLRRVLQSGAAYRPLRAGLGAGNL